MWVFGGLMDLDDKEIGVFLVVLSAVGFSTLPIFGKLGYSTGLNNSTLLAFRFMFATVFIWPFLFFRGNVRVLRGKELFLAVGLGSVGFALTSGLYFWGLGYITAGLASIILYTYPVFVVLISVFKLGESINRWTVVSLLLALVGIVLIARVDPAGADLRGVVLLLGASVFYSIYITVSRSTLLTVDSRVLSAHVIPFSFLTFLGFGLFSGRLYVPGNLNSWFVLVGIGVFSTAIPIFSFFTGLSKIGASRASIVSTIEPPITVLMGVVILNEVINLTTVFGGALILLGVSIIETKY